VGIGLEVTFNGYPTFLGGYPFHTHPFYTRGGSPLFLCNFLLWWTLNCLVSAPLNLD